MQFRILGPLEVTADDEVLDLGPRKQRALFALLLIHHGRTVSTDRILDSLWGDESNGKENALWVYISRLRSLLTVATTEDLLITRDHGYSLEIDPDDLDVAAFERLSTNGRSLLVADPRSASEELGHALSLWRGNVLEDFTYEEWAQPEIARLTSLRRATVDSRIDADLKSGRAGELIGELELALVDRPYDETPIRQLMLALYRSGRQTDALRAYERFRKLLVEDTGTDPSPELRSLEEQILFHDPRLGKGVVAEHATDAPINPYRGLAAFREEDAHLFFGRDRVVADVLETLRTHSIVTLVGPSGCGKSSIVRSGVIPAIRKAALPGSDRWLIATMVPGSHPFVELEAALLRTRIDAPDSLKDQFDGSSSEILRASLRVAPTEDTTVVILVDQFEELFTASDSAMSERFLTAAVTAADDSRQRVRFVMTLRADFYDRPLSHTGFGTAMATGIVNVVPMAPEQLEHAAAGPARSVGVRLEPELEAALVGDVLGQPGALPLFEFALTEMFDRRIGDTLTLEAYRSMGGISGTISRTADRVFDTLTHEQQSAARQVLLRLVSITDGATRSRRRVEASEVMALDIDVVDLQAVLSAFGNERLVSFDRSETTGSPTVEVAHEALLEHWTRLAAWINDAEVDLVRNARLTALASEWEDHDRDAAFLLSSGRYDDYSGWSEAATMVLARPEREFLDASAQARDLLERTEAERLSREAATARRARRSLLGLIGVVLALVAAGGLFLWSSLQPAGPTVAFFHIPSNGSDIEGMLQTGFDTAERSLDFELIDHPVRADVISEVLAAVDDGADLVVIEQSLFGDLAYSTRSPDLSTLHADFLVLDSPWPFPASNVTVARFDEPEGAYLMGVAAANTTVSGKVAFLGGWQNTYLERWLAAYEQGVHAVDPAIEVVAAWVQENGGAAFEFPDLARTQALAIYDSGVDVIFNVAGGSGSGIITAAQQYSLAHDTKMWVIGVDSDQGLLASPSTKDYILTSMIKRFDISVEESLRTWLDGDAGSVIEFDLANGGLSYSDGHAALAPALAQLETARKAIIAGTIVPNEATAVATHWTEAPDAIATVTIDSTGCLLTHIDPFSVGDRIRFTLTNTTSDVVAVDLVLMSPDATGGVLESAAAAAGDLWDAAVTFDVEQSAAWEIPPHSTYDLPMELWSHTLTAGAVFCDVGDLQASSQVFVAGS